MGKSQQVYGFVFFGIVIPETIGRDKDDIRFVLLPRAVLSARNDMLRGILGWRRKGKYKK